MIDDRPTSSTPSMIARPSCVPATLSSPARVPWVRLFAMMSVTVGPGMMVIRMQASDVGEIDFDGHRQSPALHCTSHAAQRVKPAHPVDPRFRDMQAETWMAGTSPAMTP